MGSVIETTIDKSLAENENIILIVKKTIADKTVKVVYQNDEAPLVLPKTRMVSLEKLVEMEATVAGVCSYLGSRCVDLSELLYSCYLETDEEVIDESVLEFCNMARDINNWKDHYHYSSHNVGTPWWDTLLPVLAEYKFLLSWGTAVQKNDALGKIVDTLWEAATGALMTMQDEMVCRVAISAALTVGKKVEQAYLPNNADDTIYILARMN